MPERAHAAAALFRAGLLTMAAALLALCSLALAGSPAPAGLGNRYFLSGDGTVSLTNEKTGDSARIQYRLPDGTYPEAAGRRVDRLFGIPAGSADHISLRLVSLLDYLEDRYRRPVDIISGYRSPEYNDSLRANGRLAARASLHTEGMAADIKLGNSLSPKVFEAIKALDCCGVGYYHGESLHVDTGPPRFWDETSSKVRTDISTHNKRIMVRTDRDIYLPGETVELRLARITDYPLGLVSGLAVMRNGQILGTFSLDGSQGACLAVKNPAERTWKWTIPRSFRAEERVEVRVRFCDKPFPEMPDFADSNPVVVTARTG
jgi:uncharacterized protein YcbK (DUF882 family)